MRKRVWCGGVGVLSAVLWSAVAFGAPWGMAPIHRAFLQWQADEGQAEPSGGRMARGWRPSPLDLSHVGRLARERRPLAWNDRTFPEQYDLRTRGHVSPVRDQGAWGTCWTFSALGALESALRVSGAGSWDLAERHLAWFGFVDESPVRVAFTGRTGSPEAVYSNGGDDWKAVALLARGTGAVWEADVPYRGKDDPTGQETRRVLLQEALYLPLADGTYTFPPLHQAIKQAVMTWGALSIGMWAETSDPRYYNEAEHAYRYVGPIRSDHAVCLVGWDDTFPKERFPTSGDAVARDGAWILRNSWGKAWGDGGDCYASYESALDSGVVYLGVLSDPATERIYDHDPLGWCATYGAGSETAWFANLFTAQGYETLHAVSFYVGAPRAPYEITVLTAASVDAAGTMVGAVRATATGVLDIPGYRRVVFPEAVALKRGDRFAVVVRLSTPGYAFPVPVETPLEGYSEKASAALGESYVSTNGTVWEDLSGKHLPQANVCLKAFSSVATGPPSSGGGGGGCDLGAFSGAEGWVLGLAPFLIPLGRSSGLGRTPSKGHRRGRERVS